VALTADKVQPTSVQTSDAWLEAAFLEHWNRVYAVLYRLVGERDEAEDLALETFWRLHSRRLRLQDELGLAGWLYRVATNLGLNALRARQRRGRYEAQAGRQVLSEARWDDPAEAVEKAQERQQVRTVLARMKPRSARLLVLRHSGLSYAEIAAALQVNPGSVGTLLARAEREFEGQYQALEGGSHAPDKRSN
jgi:RNA polymerase sigma-70 factor (ECF subfamily)